ncbi:hypothetical protein [Thomasclavelia spiroformis]|uniref:hypothetical protein n=1 Tax=Thomasclavelia spiroformis TaxID=29348 RepID=UPI0039945528
MPKEEFITIRCTEKTKALFNSIAASEVGINKSELFEKMLRIYVSDQELQNKKVNEILELVKLNREYLALIVNCDRDFPTNIGAIMKYVTEEPRCEKYIKMKLAREL